MEGHAVISHDVLASYAADAALQVESVVELVDGARRHRGVRVTEDGDVVRVEIHVLLEWGTRAAEAGAAVQARVAEYLRRVVKRSSVAVDVVVTGVAPRAG